MTGKIYRLYNSLVFANDEENNKTLPAVFRIRFGLNTDPDPANEINTDPDPAFKHYTDPNPGPGFFMTNIPPKISFYSEFSSQIAI